MVNGVKMVFKKELMLKRIEKLGKMHYVDDDIRALMDNLDGQEVSTSSWGREVYGYPVYACIGKNGECHDVYEGDCAAE